jgi:low affinity Fe/Cu permease
MCSILSYSLAALAFASAVLVLAFVGVFVWAVFKKA